MDVIITAGGTPVRGEPLYEYTQGKRKALLEIQGRPLIQWVLDAISVCSSIHEIVIIGMPEGANLSCSRAVTYIPDRGNLLDNLLAGLAEVERLNPASQYTLMATSDVPAVTPSMIAWLVDVVERGGNDVYYNLVTRQVMEAAFPASQRTYLRLKDIEACGGDINAIRTSLYRNSNPLWRKLIDCRKNPIYQAFLIDYTILLKILIGTLTLQEAVSRVSKKFGLCGQAVICPYAELAMDVDKVYQLELLRKYVEERNTKQTA
jgi:molybdopterin-guanine dinucleotide biosynthesis protein A